MEIDSEKLSKLNKKFKRKGLINIYFLIRKLLKSSGNKQYKKIELNLSPFVQQSLQSLPLLKLKNSQMDSVYLIV